MEACIDIINSARSATTSQELEDIEKNMELHVTAIEQLTTSVQASSRSMKKVVQRRTTDAKKKKSAADEAREKEKQDELEAEAEKVKLLAQYKTSAAVFYINWNDLGHQCAHQYADHTALQSAGSKVFSSAAKCDNHASIQALVEKEMCSQWHDAIKEPLEVKCQADAVTHKLTAAENVDAIATSLKGVMDAKSLVGDMKLQILNESAIPVLFGYSQTYVRFDFETNFLASIRVVTSGTLKMLFANPAELTSFLTAKPEALELAGGLQDISLATLTKFLQNLTADMAKAMAEKKCMVYAAIITAGEAIYTPPGWIIGAACINNGLAAGLKMCVLPQHYNTAALASVKKLAPSSDTMVLDVILANSGGEA